MIIKDEIIYPLTVIINKCFNEGIFPMELKKAKVVAVHKKGSLNIPDNYRPISILPCISKLFEIAIKKIREYFKNNILSDNQHRYRENKSTITTLMQVFKKNIDAQDNQDIAKMMFCVLFKAFDSVPHNLLLEKLIYYGVRDYLQERTQVVTNSSDMSTPLEIGIESLKDPYFCF